MNKLTTITVCLGVGVISTACTATHTPDCAPMASFAAATSAEKTASVERRIKRIIVEQLRVSPERVLATARFVADLGADSLDTVVLVMLFEKEFCVEILDGQAKKMVTVGDAIAYLATAARR